MAAYPILVPIYLANIHQTEADQNGKQNKFTIAVTAYHPEVVSPSHRLRDSLAHIGGLQTKFESYHLRSSNNPNLDWSRSVRFTFLGESNFGDPGHFGRPRFKHLGVGRSYVKVIDEAAATYLSSGDLPSLPPPDWEDPRVIIPSSENVSQVRSWLILNEEVKVLEFVKSVSEVRSFSSSM